MSSKAKHSNAKSSEGALRVQPRNSAVRRVRNMAMIGGLAESPMTLRLIDPRFSEIEDDQVRLRAWQELTSSLFVSSRASAAMPARDLFFRCYNLDRMLFLDHAACAHSAERTPSQIVTQGVDHIFIGLQTSGVTRLTGANGGAVARVGDFFVLDLAQRFQSETDGMAAIHICIPRRRFEGQGGRLSARHMHVLPSNSNPLLKLTADHLLNMRACLRRADAEQRNLLTSAALAICSAAFAEGEGSALDYPAVAAIEIRQFIEDNIDRRDLGVELIGSRFGLSRTPLYKLFETDGGVASYIRNRRLAHAMRILAGVEGGPRQRVSSVAYACGYQSEKIFSRAFRRRYGVNPREVNRTFQSIAVREKGALLASWIQSL
ncbi:helix-turn-helix transcriptional regulator [Bradyrhizobium liaoningense]|nr:helix-turn-helix transcriptional regulator [Bradyrhizobium liaoningense]